MRCSGLCVSTTVHALRLTFILVLIAAPSAIGQESSRGVNLFDGQSLKDWTQRGGKATYEIVDGTIVGTAVPHTPNSFLCTNRDYSDFELSLEFWVDDGLNSGIQIRSASRPDYQDGRVHGYQVEIDPSQRGWSAGIYDEARAGWLADLADNQAARRAFKHHQWNKLRVVARGNRIQTWLNDVPAVDFQKADVPTGFIALQVHGIGDRQEHLQVRWRNIRLLDLSEATQGDTQP